MAVWQSISSTIISRSLVKSWPTESWRRSLKLKVTMIIFKQDEAPHCNVRRDFVDAQRGIKPKFVEILGESQS
jgi:hypothetical protein